MEDVELGMRLADGGARIVLDPGLRCGHLKEWTLGQRVRSDLLARGAPWVALLLRRRSRGSSAMVLGRAQRLGALASLWAAAAVVRRRPGQVASALVVLGLSHRDLYVLLARRHGPAGVARGLLVHVVHHLTAVAAVPVGACLHAAERDRGAAAA
jgi:hypothetical protein